MIKCMLTMIVLGLVLFSTDTSSFTYTFSEKQLRNYIPIVTNNITADEVYGRIVKSPDQTAYEYLFYWEEQKGTYKFATHENDWEFIVVYVYSNGTVEQVNYDSWHYYIGRTVSPQVYNDTNVLLFVNEDFHYFKPDRGFRSGNLSWQIHNQTINELTAYILQTAQVQVGFDPAMMNDPFSWKEMGFLGRYTAFDSWWKAFWVVADKKFDFIDLSDNDRWLTKWL